MDLKIILDTLRNVAAECNAVIAIEKDDDDSYVECRMLKGAIDISINIPRHDRGYFAYGITSAALPREIYDSDISPDYTEQKRSEEVVGNVKKILSQELFFHQSPKLFRRNRGYIVLPIDGRDTKIYQNENLYKLRVVA